MLDDDQVSDEDRIHLRGQVVAGLARLAVLGEPDVKPAPIRLGDVLTPRSRNRAAKFWPELFKVSE